MKFKFRLAPALRIIELEEARKKLEIARIYRKLNALENRSIQLSSNSHLLLGFEIGKEIGPEWLGYRSQKIEVDREEMRIIEGKIVDQREVLHQKQTELTAILMKRRAFERKRDAELKVYRMGEIRKEQKLLDENHQILRLNLSQKQPRKVGT